MKESAEKRIFVVGRAEVDKRLDNALISMIEKEEASPFFFSRGALTRLIKRGLILVNGEPAKTHYLVKLRDVLEITQEAFSQNTSLSSETALDIPVIYENDDFLVLNKPAGLLMHPTDVSAEETVAHFLAATRPEIMEIESGSQRPGIVHRLDRETSGIVLVAKTLPAFTEFKRLFQARSIQKTYTALVYGNLSDLKGKIDAPLNRTSGALKRSVVRKEGTLGKIWNALTLYSVLSRYEGYDLVRVWPKTGRTHQIRVHMAGLGHPVVGDKLYAYRSQRQQKGLTPLFTSRHLLHASELTFDFSGKRYTFEAPLPTDFRQTLRDIDGSIKESYDDEALKSLLSGI